MSTHKEIEKWTKNKNNKCAIVFKDEKKCEVLGTFGELSFGSYEETQEYLILHGFQKVF